MEYIGENGDKETPVVIHRAILGSIDRFIAFIIEEFKGAFPLWLCPVQVEVINVSEKQDDYSREITKLLLDSGIRAEFDSRNEKVGYKIREAQLQKIPYMLILGEDEVASKTVSVRHRKLGDLGKFNMDDFLKLLKQEIDTKEIK